MAILTETSRGATRTPPHILTLVALVGVSTLAMNVFLPSLPAMSEYFATDYGVMQLSVGLYLCNCSSGRCRTAMVAAP